MTPHLPWVAEEIARLRSAAGAPPLLAAGGPHVSAEPELAAGLRLQRPFPRPGRKDLPAVRPRSAGREDHGRAEPDFMTAGPRPVLPERARDQASWEKLHSGLRLFQNRAAAGDHPRLFLELPLLPDRRRKTALPGPAIPSVPTWRSCSADGMSRVGFISPSALEYRAENPGRPGSRRNRSAARTLPRGRISFHRIRDFSQRDPARHGQAPRRWNSLRRYVSNRRLTFGAQSAADGRLAAIGRGHRVADIVAAVETANDAGFAVNLDFIIALPGETAGDRRDLLELLKSLRKKYRVYFQLHHFFPLAGSPFARRRPSFLSAAEHQAFSDLKKNGLASDWWLAGEKTVRDYFRWLEKKFPAVFKEYH